MMLITGESLGLESEFTSKNPERRVLQAEFHDLPFGEGVGGDMLRQQS